jgi:hypothetical protein
VDNFHGSATPSVQTDANLTQAGFFTLEKNIAATTEGERALARTICAD